MAKFLAYRKKLKGTEDDASTDADIWLFAEDLLNFVFRNHPGFPIKPVGEERQKFVHKGFTNTVRFAIEITQIKLSAEIDAAFAEISKKDDVVEAYCKYVTNIRKVLRSGGFDGSQFIHYCVLVAFLGEKFYQTGLRDFHYQTFAAVRRGFKKTDMANGGWSILECAADAITTTDEPVEKLRCSVPSPDVEQSPLETDGEQRYIDNLVNTILIDSDCLSDSSVGSDSSIAKPASIKSNESLHLCNISDYESEKVKSEDLSSKVSISPRKRPAQLSTTSSSTEILRLPTPTDNFLNSYIEKRIHVTDRNSDMDNFHDEILDFQDLSKHSDLYESCSELRLNTSPEHLSPSDQLAKRNKIELEKVDIHSENSSETVNSQKENEIPIDWSFSLPLEQISKPNSESRRLPVFSELSTKAQEPNSTESTPSTSKSSGFTRF